MRYFLTKEITTIGRAGHNDICLPDPAVSRTHLAIVLKGDRLIATDRSTNGTFVNDEKISTCELTSGDVIRIGEWSVRFASPSSAEAETTLVSERDPTRILEFRPDQNELVLERAFLDIQGPAPRTFPIRKATLTVGKAESNDVVLGDEYVSTFHLRIENRGGLFFLKDLNSTNGTLLNGQRVGESQIPQNALIEAGRTKIRFRTETEAEQLKPFRGNAFESIYSSNPRMQQLFALIDRVAKSDTTVFIFGETGTGKELFAQAVHRRSGRSRRPFVAVNCGAISKDLIESELFGHEKGAFTSAAGQRRGAFEQAHTGTLFLDELGELPLDLQPKLLRVLETGEIRRVGGNQSISIDVRVVVATNRNLVQDVRDGRFRNDLFYRVFVMPIEVPPLRARREDVPLLARVFLNEAAVKETGVAREIDQAAMDRLVDYTWPGNVRELKHVITRALMTCTTSTISAGDLQFAPVGITAVTAYDVDERSVFDPKTVTRTLRDVERERILQALEKHQGSKRLAAKELGIAKSTLHDKLRKHGIQVEED